MNTQTLEPNGEDWTEWLSPREAAKQLGVLVSDINAMARKGEIVRWKCPDGKVRFSPLEVERTGLALRAAVETQDQFDGQTSEVKHLLRAAVSMLRQAESEKTALLKLITDPMNAAMTALREANEAQAVRLQRLEEYSEQMVMAREELLSRQHEREMMTLQTMGTEERKNAAMATLQQHAPRFLAAAEGAVKRLAAGDSRLTAAVELLDSMDPAMLGALADSGMLTERQKELLRQVAPQQPQETTS